MILQHLLCDAQDGQWKLSQQHYVDDALSVQNAVELVHVSWDHGGNCLAAIDSYGRTSIYATYITVNRMSTFRRRTIDPEDDLGAVVGLMWLHIDRPVGRFHQGYGEGTNTKSSLSTISPASKVMASGTSCAPPRKYRDHGIPCRNLPWL